jgi:hypothetical protein
MEILSIIISISAFIISIWTYIVVDYKKDAKKPDPFKEWRQPNGLLGRRRK